MKFFLTGGTGLIGSHVAERLRERGDDVVALVRETSDRTHLARLGCTLVTGDVLDPPDVMAGCMDDCDGVIHAAAKVFQKGKRSEYIAVNVTGTERVLAAAAKAAPRVVHVSSVAVYAGVSMDRPLSEERWTMADPERQGSYPASKHLSEQAAWRLHDAGEIRLTTVRPSVVYGERDRAFTPAIMRAFRLPVVPLPGGGQKLLPLVYAGNVARGIVAALARDRAIGEAYNLAMDEPITALELFGRIAAELGRRPPAVRIPPAVTLALAGALDLAASVLPWRSLAGVIRGARQLSRDNPYPVTRARIQLDWTELIPHDEGIRRTMKWWRSKEAE